jgi:hypothetical protein
MKQQTAIFRAVFFPAVLCGAQDAIFTYHGASAGNRVGASVCGAGDVNRDGYDDVIVGTIQERVDAFPEAGRVRIYSGFDGALLYTYTGAGRFHHLGQAVSRAGDVNQDGYGDFMMAAPNGDSPVASGVGQVIVASGRDGAVLHNVFGSPPETFSPVLALDDPSARPEMWTRTATTM